MHKLHVSHCRQMRTEPRLQQVTCTETLVKFEHVVFEICEYTYRQTNYEQTYILSY